MVQVGDDPSLVLALAHRASAYLGIPARGRTAATSEEHERQPIREEVAVILKVA